MLQRISPNGPRRVRVGWLGCLALMLGHAAWPAEPPAGQLLLLAVAINGEPPSEPLTVFQAQDGRFFISDEALDTLHLRHPASAPREIDHQAFFALGDVGATQTRLEAATQLLLITIPASAFNDSTYNQHPTDALTLDNPAFGGFVNYDVFYQHDTRAHLSGLVEAGAFFGGGTLTSRYVGQDLTGNRSVYRLDTQYQRDFPAQAATLVIGDSVSGASAWSRSVYFGGLQWHTNFGTRPDLQPIPLPSITGSAAVPSTVDLYVDNVLRGRQTVDAGPFTLNNIPTLSGQGNLTLVVHDALGRQQIFVQNYITSPTLLRAGTISDSFEVGALHNDFGQANSGYGAGFASATLRYGVTDTQTVEAHAEGSSFLGAAGFGASQAFRNIGVLTLGAAASAANGDRQGGLGYIEFDHATTQFGFSVRTQFASSSFQQLGLVPGEGVPKATSQIQLSAQAAEHATVLLGYTAQSNRGVADFRSVNFGLNLSLEHLGSIFAGLVQTFAPARSISANLLWTIPLDDLTYLQLGTSDQNHQKQSTIELDSAPPPELGWGYRLRQAFGDPAGSDAGVTYRGETGEYSLSGSNLAGQNTVLAEARGGFVALGGHVLATKWLDQSFALVTVPTDVPVDIYSNNVKVGRTNSDGVGLVPNLVAYEKNHVALDPKGLPLQMSMDLSVRDVTPSTRTGVIVAFDIHDDHGATLMLLRHDGSPMPNGTLVEVSEQKISANVALHGEVFFRNIAFPARLVVHDDGNQCLLAVQVPETDEAFPKLGPFTCE